MGQPWNLPRAGFHWIGLGGRGLGHRCRCPPNFLFCPCAAPLMDPWALAEPLEEHSYRNLPDSYRQRQALWAVAKTAALLYSLPSGWWRFVGSTAISCLLLCSSSWTEPTGRPTSTSSLPQCLLQGAEPSRSWSRQRSIAMGHGLLCLLPWWDTLLNRQLTSAGSSLFYLHPMEPTTSPTLQIQGHHKLCKKFRFESVPFIELWVQQSILWDHAWYWPKLDCLYYKVFPHQRRTINRSAISAGIFSTAYLNLITVWMALLISSFVFLPYAVSERVLRYINLKKTRKLFNTRFVFKLVPSFYHIFIQTPL